MPNLKRNISIDAMEDEERVVPQANTTFRKENYLNVRLDKGQNEKEIIFRLLPIDAESNTPFKTIYMHNVTVPKEINASGFKAYVCLNKTEDIDHERLGHKCPFCEMQHDAYEKKKEAHAAGDKTEEERWQKISLGMAAKPVCVMRGIERGAEADGPKFLKVWVRDDGKDVKSMIKELARTRKQESIDEALLEYGVKTVEELPEDFEPMNIFDLETGKDLKLTIKRVFNKQGEATDKTSITVMDYGKQKPLSRDEDEMNAWIEDEKVWSDVFVAKGYDYCSLILDGEVPFFDKENKKWIPKMKKKEEEAEEKAEKTAEADEKIKQAEKKALASEEVEDYEENNEAEEVEDTDDLPF